MFLITDTVDFAALLPASRDNLLHIEEIAREDISHVLNSAGMEDDSWFLFTDEAVRARVHAILSSKVRAKISIFKHEPKLFVRSFVTEPATSMIFFVTTDQVTRDVARLHCHALRFLDESVVTDVLAAFNQNLTLA